MVVLDGAGDRLGPEKTPLEAASTPHLDALVRKGSLGLLYTVGRGIAPESDAGVFSLLGYDPLQTHLARGIVETIGAGVQFHDGDLALRAGFATVMGDRLVDRRAGRDLATKEALEFAAALNKDLHLKDGIRFEFKATVGHRAVVVFRSPDHKFSSNISNFDPAYLRKGMISLAQPGGKRSYEIPRCEALDVSEDAIRTAALINEFGFKTRQILDRHPVNERRRRLGKLPANFVLMRDAGVSKPDVPSFAEKWGLEAVMIADLPVELGIGRLLEMSVEELAPGTAPEDYRKRARLILELAGRYDFVYVHLKGPDEAGHDGLSELKKRRIEEIDAGFFSTLRTASELKNLVLCVTCDHSTPWKEMGHGDDPVPVLIAGGSLGPDGSSRFSEKEAQGGGLGIIEHGRTLLQLLRRYAA